VKQDINQLVEKQPTSKTTTSLQVVIRIFKSKQLVGLLNDEKPTSSW
jgi:hypothetical protein